MSDIINQVSFAYSGIDEAFPAVDPNFVPFGSRVLVQIRSAKRKTAAKRKPAKRKSVAKRKSPAKRKATRRR